MEIRETENPKVSEYLSADDIRDLLADVRELVKKVDRGRQSLLGKFLSWLRRDEDNPDAAVYLTRDDLIEFRGILREFAADLEQAALAADVQREASGDTYAPPLKSLKK